jgi:hypothetical protein
MPSSTKKADDGQGARALGRGGMTNTDNLIDFVLRQLDLAKLDLLLEVNQIETTTVALKAGIISVEAAVAHVDQLGLIPAPSSSAAAA